MAKISINLKEGSIQEEQETIIGIDLGTTNSLVAYIKDGKAEAVKGRDGKSTLLPSIIYFAPDNSLMVGEDARKKLEIDPANTIYSVKRLMGKSYKDVEGLEEYLGYEVIDEDTDSLVKIRVRNQFYTPIELSARILEALKKRIEAELGTMVSKAVITVPAYFNDAQRQATRDAGKLAGLNVLRIVNEPTAAALAYGIDRISEEAQTIAVYDLGGGTFDISILRIQNGIFEVLSTNGDTFLGGDDIDRAIVNYWVKINGLDTKKLAEEKQLSQKLRLVAERAKKAMSTASQFKETLFESINCQITTEIFDRLASPLVEKTLEACTRALKDAQLTVDQIDHIVMVGGSTKAKLVQKEVSKYFGKPLFNDLNPDEVVALGAAIQADVLSGNQKDLLLLDITPLSLGIETVGGLMDVIIPRNAKVPTRVGRQYTTSVDGQKNLKIAVFQGERDLIEHNRKLGEFVLSGIPPMPAGLPKIEIRFLLDADGILKVQAQELRSGVEQEIEIRSQYGLSEEEMAKMLIDSIQNAESDMKARALLEARNEANTILLSSDKFLSQHSNILTEEEIATTQSLTQQLKKAVSGEDKDLINQYMDDLNKYTSPLAHRAMDVTIAEAMKGKDVSGK